MLGLYNGKRVGLWTVGIILFEWSFYSSRTPQVPRQETRYANLLCPDPRTGEGTRPGDRVSRAF